MCVAVEETDNALVLLNNQPCLGAIMRVGRPKSYTGAPGVPGGMGMAGLPMMPGVWLCLCVRGCVCVAAVCVVVRLHLCVAVWVVRQR